MKISLDWLREYIKLDQSIEEITNLLTFAGIEVEEIICYGNLSETIITAKILECNLLQDSDHLFLCLVDTSQEILQVVCGALNCKQGMVGVLALPGTKLRDMVIKKNRIRGVESFGMLCSEKELGLSDDHNGIMRLPTETEIGIPVSQILSLPDTLLELEITPNRPDLLGYIGVATDLSACSDCELIMPIETDLTALENTHDINDNLELINNELELCPRYTARVIKNVKITESPLWLKQRLIRSGLRPINSVVDITNYVMLEYGHPLHAFDYDKLDGIGNKPSIIIRKATAKEEFYALDGKVYTLTDNDLVIADSNKAVALAGVIGSTNSHITENTVNIVLEAAFFEHTSIRRTAYYHKISTDSSYRFERNLASETTDIISQRASQMILELAGGSLCKGNLDIWTKQNEENVIGLRPSRIKAVYGIYLSRDLIISYLSKLGLIYINESLNHINDNVLSFIVPANRTDLTREIDLIEEVIRLHGMDKVGEEKQKISIMDRHAFLIKRKATDYLVHNGFYEVVNLSFTDPQMIYDFKLNENDIRLNQISLLNPQNSNLSVMRSFLLPQLVLNARYNFNRGESQIKLFELNKVFYENYCIPKNEPYQLCFLCTGTYHNHHWQNKPKKLDFFAIKGIVEGLIRFLGLKDYTVSNSTPDYLIPQESQCIIHNNHIIAVFGKLNPEIAARFDIDTAEIKQDIWVADIDINDIIMRTRNIITSYQPVPKFPSVERDISFLISIDVSYDDIIQLIKQSNPDTLFNAYLIDEYLGKQVSDGYKSLTYRLIFNHSEKTLTDDEVNVLIDLIINNLKSQWDIQLR